MDWKCAAGHLGSLDINKRKACRVWESNFQRRVIRYVLSTAVPRLQRVLSPVRLHVGANSLFFLQLSNKLLLLALHFFRLPEVVIARGYKPAFDIGVVAGASLSVALPRSQEQVSDLV